MRKTRAKEVLMEPVSRYWDLTKTGKTLYNMHIEDYRTVKAFLDRNRDALDRKEFFYPYTDDELSEILRSGKFLGCYRDERLIATFGIDADRGYAEKLAEIVKTCTRGRLAPQRAFEASGLMVDADCRGQGIASAMMRALLKAASEIIPDDWLCGVVHLDNAASMNVFLKHGFVLGGVWRMDETYDFGYFVRPVQSAVAVEDGAVDCGFRDLDRHKALLADGYSGYAINGCNRIAYGRAKESIYFCGKGEDL